MVRRSGLRSQNWKYFQMRLLEVGSIMWSGNLKRSLIAKGKVRHTNELELIAAFYALQAFTAELWSIKICLYLDNSTAVAYINHCGGTVSKQLRKIALQITEWCEVRNFTIQAVHLPGILNVVADAESRALPRVGDWQLCPDVFKFISEIWPVEIDLFAAAWNTQLPRFAAWDAQPGAEAKDAFKMSWKSLQGYIFPPFSLVQRCLAKIYWEKATGTLVCPFWPSQYWFPGLLELAVEVPLVLLPRRNLLRSSDDHPHPLLEDGSLFLSVWRLSGHRSEDGIPQEVAALLLAGNRSNTSAAYQSAWVGWNRWCMERNKDPMEGDMISILSYLENLYSSGKKYSTINVHRSMLASKHN